MPIFSANISLLYTDLAFIDRLAAAKADGFDAVECQFPYEASAGCALEDLKAKTVELGIPMTLINLPAGDWAGGDRGIACDPARVAEFKAGIPLAIKYSKGLHVDHVNCLAGIPPAGISQEVARATLIANLTWAAEELKKESIKLLIEPINTFDIPGFFLNHSEQAVQMIMEVTSTNLYLQYDAYHMHRMGEDILDLEDFMPFIDHIQIADHPGRNEPGTGEMNYPEFFMLLDDLGYDGWVGCEYKKLHRSNFFKN